MLRNLAHALRSASEKSSPDKRSSERLVLLALQALEEEMNAD